MRESRKFTAEDAEDAERKEGLGSVSRSSWLFSPASSAISAVKELRG
jgi:hypothetical protein